MIINNTVNRGAFFCPQTLHTYIQPHPPGGRHKQREHYAAVLLLYNTVERRHAHCVWAAGQLSLSEIYISANSLQEMCFLIGPSSQETVKLQKTTVKARGTDYEGK